MNGDMVRQTVQMVRTVCADHAIEPLIPLTSVSDRCFDLTVPILLLSTTQPELLQHTTAPAALPRWPRHRRTPYRIGIEAMPLLVAPSPYWRMVSTVKHAMDPHEIIPPGRYSS